MKDINASQSLLWKGMMMARTRTLTKAMVINEDVEGVDMAVC